MQLKMLIEMARERPIKAVALVRHRDGTPEPEKGLSELQLSRRLAPLLPLIASGQVQVPDDMAPAVGRAIEHAWTKENNNAG